MVRLLVGPAVPWMRAFVTPMVSTAHADVCWLDNQSIGKMPMTLPNGHQLLGHQAHHASYRYCSEEFLFSCTQFLLCDAKVILLAPSRSIWLQHVMHKEWASLWDCKCDRLVSMWWLPFLGNTKSVQPGSPTWSSSIFHHGGSHQINFVLIACFYACNRFFMPIFFLTGWLHRVVWWHTWDKLAVAHDCRQVIVVYTTFSHQTFLHSLPFIGSSLDL